MSQATACFIDSCIRMRVPVSVAKIMLTMNKKISMTYGDVSIRWFLMAGGYSAMEIMYTDRGLQHYFFRPDGLLA